MYMAHYIFHEWHSMLFITFPYVKGVYLITFGYNSYRTYPSGVIGLGMRII